MTGGSLLRLLMIEDNRGDAILIREMLADQTVYRIDLTHVESMTAAALCLSTEPVDVILLDLVLPDAHGLEAIESVHALAPHVPLVILTALDDESLAARALEKGAQEHLIKGQVDTGGLVRALRYAVERKLMEEALFLEKERALVTLYSVGDAVASTDGSGHITFLNPVAETMTGWSLADAAGRPSGEVFQILDAGSRQPIPDPMMTAMGQDRAMHLPPNCILMRRDGHQVSIEDSVAPIHDRHGRATGAVIILRDVTATRAMALEMFHAARHDFLTGLPNRVLLNDRLTHSISVAHRDDKSVAVLFLDVDGFKHINDSLGHGVGDKLLQSVAARLVESVRDADTVSRQGGDEFVVLLSQLDHPGDAAISARRLLRAVAEPHPIDEHDLLVTASVGVSVYPGDGDDAGTLIKNADIAMHQAKDDGPGGYTFFKPSMNVRAVERQSLEEGLRHALERQEMALHYQPTIDLRTGVITGAEALLRWTHPVRGPVLPAQFIPLAEDCGMIVPIGHWVLREACAQACAWIRAGLPIPMMAVNISGKEFRSEHFLDGIFSVLAETGLDPGRLELELTETVLMNRVQASDQILSALRAGGVRLAIDDFGTGYSSLSYLRRFPVDMLKIDRSFVSGITNGGDEATIVDAVIGMGHGLNLRVLAEGVETPEELAFLQARGCDEAQGYYFSHPVPPAEFAALLEASVDAAGAP